MALHMSMHDDIKLEGSDIERFLSGANIFVTGGTGFLGKLLIEKLLRTCPTIKNLFMLVRSKKEKPALTRIEDQFSDELYDLLRENQPNFVNKIIPVSGDVSCSRLGLSDQDWTIISNEVDIIFHSAATIRFDEPLKRAVEVNVRGTRELVTLARSCSKLRVLVHVSTAYSNCPQKTIEEKFYESPVSPEALIALVETTDEKRLDAITPGLIGEWPNTYTFTKAIAEKIVRTNGKSLPTVVVRPSIVISACEDPIPGWIDPSNVYGPSGLIIGVGLGVVHCVLANYDSRIDFVPADLVTNTIIGAAWRTARDHVPQQEPPIYNFVCGARNPLYWRRMYEYLNGPAYELVSLKSVWYPFGILTSNRYLYLLLLWTLHFIPAFIVDRILQLTGKKPILVKIFNKVNKLEHVLTYFINNEWDFEDNNTQALQRDLNPSDKKTFNCDIASLDWDMGLHSWLMGARIYIVKDPMSTIPEAKKKAFKLKCLHYFICGIISFAIIRVLWAVFNMFI